MPQQLLLTGCEWHDNADQPAMIVTRPRSPTTDIEVVAILNLAPLSSTGKQLFSDRLRNSFWCGAGREET